MRFRCLPFVELTTGELHDLLRLRCDVFVVEQRCVYPEIDGRDPRAIHLLGLEGGRLTAYARWLPEGEAVRLGRIVVAPESRGGGRGEELVVRALEEIGPRPVVIHAQAPLEKWYARLGFRTVSEPFDEDGIPHVVMRREAD